jgi:hypothetical protein
MVCSGGGASLIPTFLSFSIFRLTVPYYIIRAKNPKKPRLELRVFTYFSCRKVLFLRDVTGQYLVWHKWLYKKFSGIKIQLKVIDINDLSFYVLRFSFFVYKRMVTVTIYRDRFLLKHFLVQTFVWFYFSAIIKILKNVLKMKMLLVKSVNCCKKRKMV